MECTIRRLTAQDLPAAMELAMDTFLRFEAPDYGPEGVKSFRRTVIENEDFLAKCRSGENRMWGAFDGNKLIGLYGMRGKSHICLVFTHHAYHRKGIATALLQSVLADLRKEDPALERITLNSSPCGLPFYQRMGFYTTDTEKTVDGIRFTSMAFDLH